MQKKTVLVSTLILLLVISLPLLAARKSDRPEAERAPLAEEQIQATLISWEANRPYQQMRLVVSGPEGLAFEGDFEAGFPLVYDLLDRDGNPLPDGQYSYSLVATPLLSPEVREMMARARETGDELIGEELRASGAIPDENSMRFSGSFQIVDGSAVIPELDEETDRRPGPGTSYRLGRGVAPQDQVILDDLIVDGSICVGLDCVNGESFGFDTLRLKENNLRIHFQDTSSSASFPTRDWRITINDSSNGGQNRFSIDDVDVGRTPFTIESGAPSHCIYCDDAGRVGLGTNSPVVELHILDGDSPTVRLDQDGSSGFTAQTWDLAGNEANFFVRDATNGSRLPFKIRPNAPTDSLVIEGSTGDIGLGAGTNPTAALHVRRTSAQAAILVDDQNNGTGAQIVIQDSGTGATNKPGFIIRSADAASSGDWAFETDSGGNFQIDFRPSSGPELLITDATTTNGSTIQLNGNVTIAGSLTKASGAFKIDHPLDPENKTLSHSFVESPDMMNIYNGNVVLDANGEAWVTMPEWFQALNRDFRYQLTAIGAPGPNLYVASEISDNRFQIAGGVPESRVSWQVTGVRHDRFAEVNRIPVEEVKPEQMRGTYLHPQVFEDSAQRADGKKSTEIKKVDDR